MKVLKVNAPVPLNIRVLRTVAKTQFGEALLDCNETDFGVTVSCYLSDDKPEAVYISNGTT